MRFIAPQNVRYAYFMPDEDVRQASSQIGLETIWPNEFMRSRWNALPNIRLVGVQWPGSRNLLMYWLYWGGDVDLSALDKRVREGIYTDHDFEGAVKTQYSLTVCPVCGSQWDTLIIPPGDPYLGAPGLYEKKVEEWVRKIRGCPACGARLRQLVVQVLGEHGRQ